MMLTPFKIVYELFVFGIQALFIYGLALIIVIGLIGYTIAQHPSKKEWSPEQEKIEYIKKVYPTSEEVIKEPECIRPAGCRVLEDGTIEY